MRRDLLGLAVGLAFFLLAYVGATHGWHIDPPGLCVGFDCPAAPAPAHLRAPG